MTAPRPLPSLIERLPEVRGSYRAGAALKDVTWFRVGGPAEVMFRPADIDDLCLFLRGKPADVAVTVLGVGSNLLVRDGGVPGVVIRLGRGFASLAARGHEIEVGAGALDSSVAMAACQAGIAGFEFLAGIPGTIGGALRMNAGAYGAEIAGLFVAAEAVSPDGARHLLGKDDMGFSYRHCGVPADWIFTSARLRGAAGVPAAIAARIAGIKAEREGSQPVRSRTGGSTFTNPPGAKAWELIARAGCRGLRIGGAAVSEKHSNFLINEGGATASDLERLGEEVRRRVHEATGVTLEWEIRRIGVPGNGGITATSEVEP